MHICHHFILLLVLSSQLFRAEAASSLHTKQSRHLKVAVLKVTGCSGPNVAGMLRTLNAYASEFNLSYDTLDAKDIISGKLADYDVLAVPGGNHLKMAIDLGAKGQQAIRSFIATGGGYVGSCGGFYLAEWLGILPTFSDGTGKTKHGLSGDIVCTTKEDCFFSDKPIDFAEIDTIRLPFFYGPIAKLLPASLFDEKDPRHRAHSKVLFEAANDLVAEYVSYLTDPQDFSDPNHITLGLPATEAEDLLPKRGIMPLSAVAISTTYGKGRIVAFTAHPELISKSDPTSKATSRIFPQALRAVQSQADSRERKKIFREHYSREAAAREKIIVAKWGYQIPRLRDTPQSYLNSLPESIGRDQAIAIATKILPAGLGSQHNRINTVFQSISKGKLTVATHNWLNTCAFPTRFQETLQH